MTAVLLLTRAALAATTQNRREVGAIGALVRHVRSLRLLLVPRVARSALDTRRRLLGSGWSAPAAHLVFIQHTFYLSKDLRWYERPRAALDHLRFIEKAFSAGFLRHLERTGGVTLWERRSGAGEIALRLQPAVGPEGELSVVALVNGQPAGVVSFAFTRCTTPARLSHGTTLFVARSQSGLTRDKLLDTLPVSRPQSLCMAAVEGIALAVGATRIVGIGHAAQYCYSASRHASFMQSYDDFWRQQGGSEIPGGFALPVPLVFRALDQIEARHRQRARRRRALQAEISASSRAGVGPWVACAPPACRETPRDGAATHRLQLAD